MTVVIPTRALLKRGFWDEPRVPVTPRARGGELGSRAIGVWPAGLLTGVVEPVKPVPLVRYFWRYAPPLPAKPPPARKHATVRRPAPPRATPVSTVSTVSPRATDVPSPRPPRMPRQRVPPVRPLHEPVWNPTGPAPGISSRVARWAAMGVESSRASHDGPSTTSRGTRLWHRLRDHVMRTFIDGRRAAGSGV